MLGEFGWLLLALIPGGFGFGMLHVSPGFSCLSVGVGCCFGLFPEGVVC